MTTGQGLTETNSLRAKSIITAGNSTFAIGGVSYSADSLVVAESFVLRIKFSGKIPPIANLQPVRCNSTDPVQKFKYD
jgi:hypothetical protein